MRSTKLTAILLGLALCVSSAHAVDGTLATGTDDTSTATTDLDITIPVFVKVTGLTDNLINEAAYDPADDVDNNDAICIYSNDEAATVKVKLDCLTKAGAACTAFEITEDPVDDVIPYTVYFNSGTGQATTSRARDTEITFADASQSIDCSGHTLDTHNVRVSFDPAAILAKPHGSYGGTLLVKVYPPSS